VVQQHRGRVGETALAFGPVVGARAPRVGRRRQRLRLPRLQHLPGRVKHRLLLLHPRQLPAPERREGGGGQQRQRPAQHQRAAPAQAWSRAGLTPPAAAGADNAPLQPRPEPGMSDSLKTLLIIAFLLVIVWNLGAGLYYMLVDKGQTKRTVNALTRRIGL